ncbi:MAG: FHA domain-containing protein [Anaerolineales bacterium]|nr:FHA domain-containing protein [Anaerolineales bacterium]
MAEIKPKTEYTQNAYLIVNSEVFPIRNQLTNLGRKLDNHIVLNDPRVSRNHAQIRVMESQFILLDLNSTGGTMVNGKKVSKSVLYSGDSISLAGLEIKFVQDTPRMISKAMDRTQPLDDGFKYEEIPTQIIPNRFSNLDTDARTRKPPTEE